MRLTFTAVLAKHKYEFVGRSHNGSRIYIAEKELSKYSTNGWRNNWQPTISEFHIKEAIKVVPWSSWEATRELSKLHPATSDGYLFRHNAYGKTPEELDDFMNAITVYQITKALDGK